jgi:hypothetical protein
MLLAALVIVVSFTCPALAVQLSSPDEVVWNWFSKCSDIKSLTIEITHNDKILYKSSFPICQLRRRDIPVELGQKRLVFFLEKSEKRSFLGEPKGVRIEGNIWKAGGDPDAIILSVSFDTKERVWLNTLHIAYPEKASKSVLARGLVIKTYPGQRITERK